MATAYTSLLGLALPVTGELSGTWGDTVNNSITSLLDTAVAGTTTLSTDADVTLTTTTGSSNQSRQAILLWTANGTTTRNITAPAQSKIYTVINASAGTQSIVLRGAGPTTGVTIVKGESAVCAWNGSDFIKISNTSGAGVFTTLSVSGVASFAAGSASAPAITRTGDTNTGIFFPAADTIAFAEGGVEAMRLDSAGNLCVGTTSANGRIDVQNNQNATSNFYFRNTDTTNTNSRAALNVIAGNQTASLLAINSDNVFLQRSSGSLQFQNAGSTQMLLDASGNLGVGTTSPSTYGKFVAYSSGGYASIDGNGFVNSAQLLDTASAGGRFSGYSSRGLLGAIKIEQTTTGADGGYMAFGTCASGSTTYTERARIDSSGNLLVGTTSGLGSVGRGQFAQSSTANAAISADATSSSFAYTIAYFNTNTAAGTGFNFINCTTSNYTSAQFRVRGDGTIYAQNTTVQSISDERLKENIRDSSDGISVINALRPVRYDWKEGYGNDRKNQLGFIAQEVEAIFPEAVSEWQVDEKDETVYKTVGPGALIPVLVKALQEQQAIITQLQADVAALKGN